MDRPQITARVTMRSAFANQKTLARHVHAHMATRLRSTTKLDRSRTKLTVNFKLTYHESY